jgi:phosphoglycolate phosphatase-like HAD superfamily hydrolase
VKSNAIKRRALYDLTEYDPAARPILDQLYARTPHLDRYGLCAELAKQLKGIDPDVLAQKYTDQCEELILSAPEVPGALEALNVLKGQGRRMVIISSTPERPLKRLVSRSQFALLIHEVFGRPATKGQNLQKAMAVNKFTADDVVIIGDSEDDRRAAETEKCDFVAVLSDNNLFTKAPKTMIRRMDELLAWI